MLSFVKYIAGDVNELLSLDTRLQQRYAHSLPDPDVTWSFGSAVAACYDELFYRAKIIGFDDDGIEVLFLHNLSACTYSSDIIPFP